MEIKTQLIKMNKIQIKNNNKLMKLKYNNQIRIKIIEYLSFFTCIKNLLRMHLYLIFYFTMYLNYEIKSK